MPGRLKISIVSELWTDVRFVIKSQSSIQRRHGPLDVIMHIHFLQPCFLHFNNMHERNEPTLSPCFSGTHKIETLLTHRLILKSTRSPTRLVLLLVRLSRQSCCASWDADDIDREFFYPSCLMVNLIFSLGDNEFIYSSFFTWPDAVDVLCHFYFSLSYFSVIFNYVVMYRKVRFKREQIKK